MASGFKRYLFRYVVLLGKNQPETILQKNYEGELGAEFNSIQIEIGGLDMRQYAICDDHDFGPDNSGASYGLKAVSREIFMKYWCNPFYGEDKKGIYPRSLIAMNLFLTDDRYSHGADEQEDSKNKRCFIFTTGD